MGFARPDRWTAGILLVVSSGLSTVGCTSHVMTVGRADAAADAYLQADASADDIYANADVYAADDIYANADVYADAFEPKGYAITVTSVNGLTKYSHQFAITADCEGRLSGTGRYTGSDSGSVTSETISNIVLDHDVLKFKASYDWTAYIWYPAFVLHDDGTWSFQDGYGPDNVLDAIGTWSPLTGGGCDR